MLTADPERLAEIEADHRDAIQLCGIADLEQIRRYVVASDDGPRLCRYISDLAAADADLKQCRTASYPALDWCSWTGTEVAQALFAVSIWMDVTSFDPAARPLVERFFKKLGSTVIAQAAARLMDTE